MPKKNGLRTKIREEKEERKGLLVLEHTPDNGFFSYFLTGVSKTKRIVHRLVYDKMFESLYVTSQVFCRQDDT
jgi:hypothetical protein